MRVLLVDDSLEDAQLIERELHMLPGELDFSLVDCEAKLAEEIAATGFDVVLFDYVLPDTDWRRALALVRAHDAFVPFIVVSGKRGEEFVVETVGGGCADYVVKDRLVRLVPAIEREVEVARTRRRGQELEERMERRFARAERAEAVGTLAAGLAHNLNNLLTVTLAGLRSLPKSTDPDANDALGDAIESTERATEILRELLDLGQPRGSEQRPLQPAAVLERVASMLRRTVPGGVEVECRCAPEVTVWANESELEQAVLNLALNARAAISPPGRIVLAAEEFELGEAEARRVAPGRYVRLSVEDSGMGIPSDIVEQVFDPFFTTRGEGGSGLGLATVAACARRHGGWPEVESAAGSGSKFALVIRVAGP